MLCAFAASPQKQSEATQNQQLASNKTQADADDAESFMVKEPPMAKNEKTGKKAGTAASKVLKSGSTGKASKTAAGSALTQRPDKKK
jgi:hypothetical protein